MDTKTKCPREVVFGEVSGMGVRLLPSGTPLPAFFHSLVMWSLGRQSQFSCHAYNPGTNCPVASDCVSWAHPSTTGAITAEQGQPPPYFPWGLRDQNQFCSFGPKLILNSSSCHSTAWFLPWTPHLLLASLSLSDRSIVGAIFKYSIHWYSNVTRDFSNFPLTLTAS